MQRDPTYDAVARQGLEPIARQLQKMPPALKRPSGYLYVVRIVDDPKTVKIGISCDVRSRLSQLQSSNPLELSAFLVIRSKDCRELERTAHRRFDDERVRGEWFQVSEAALLAFAGDFRSELMVLGDFSQAAAS